MYMQAELFAVSVHIARAAQVGTPASHLLTTCRKPLATVRSFANDSAAHLGAIEGAGASEGGVASGRGSILWRRPVDG